MILPRFRGEGRVGLGKALAEMGMPTAFGESADFSGICPGLRIDKVLHAGKIAVDEEGTQAQAATVATKKAWAMEPIEFRADRPFYYMIVDYQTRAVLFLGRCSEPK